MQSKDSRPLQSNDWKQQNSDPADNPPDPSEGIVMGDALEYDRFRDGDCAGICPGCGNVVSRHFEGLSDPFVLYRPTCRECGVELQRWSVVVVPSIQRTAVPSLDKLKNRVQQYWERQFRIGVQDDGLPHTREFADEIEDLAETWGWEWTLTCPLCDRSLDHLSTDYLGYHHWNYSSDIGTSICVECHDYIHGGDKQNQANRQDWRAKQLGLSDFRDLAVIRLSMRDQRVHEPDLDEDDLAYANRLRHRYNIPLPVTRIYKLVSEVRTDDVIASTIQELGADPDVAEREIYSV